MHRLPAGMSPRQGERGQLGAPSTSASLSLSCDSRVHQGSECHHLLSVKFWLLSGFYFVSGFGRTGPTALLFEVKMNILCVYETLCRLFGSSLTGSDNYQLSLCSKKISHLEPTHFPHPPTSKAKAKGRVYYRHY